MNQAKKAPWHLWTVGVLTLAWNAVGILSYMMTRLGKLDALGMTPDQIAYFEAIPWWANAFWALGVWGAFLGSILILLRSRWATISLVVALVGLLGTTFHQYAMADLPAELSNPALDVAIWVITLFMLWYARRMTAAGVLR